MSESNKVTVHDHDYVVPVLTIARIREILDLVISRTDAEGDLGLDLVGGELFSELSLRELSLIAGIDSKELEQLTPAAVRPLVEKIKVMNPDYIALRRRLMAIGDMVQEKLHG